LAFHQQAADELGGDHLGRAGEKGCGEGLGERGGYRSGLGDEIICLNKRLFRLIQARHANSTNIVQADIIQLSTLQVKPAKLIPPASLRQ